MAKGKKGKSKKAAPKPKKAGKGKKLDTGSFAMQVCSITNPFCVEAIQARWPDNSYTKSAGWSITNAPQVIGSDANGKACILCYPEGYYSVGTVTGNTSANAALAAFQSWPSNTVRYRITSWGIKVNCVLTPLSAQGYLRVRLFSPMGGSTLASTSIVSNMADAVYDVPLARLINEDFFIIPSALGDNARFFRDTAAFSTTLASYVNPGWQIVQLALDGAPTSNSTALSFSVFYNLEFVFADGDSQTSFCAPPPPDSPPARAASASVFERIGNFIEGSAEKVDRLFQSKAMQLGARVGMSLLTRNPAPLMIRNVD